jgi:ankyrin repeat protein
MNNNYLKFTLYFLLIFSSVISAQTPNEHLLKAAEASDLSGIKKALANDADINTTDLWDYTPLHRALDHKRDRGSFTALQEAANNHVIAFLLANNANVNAQNLYEETPLHMATTDNRVDTMALLLKYGANVETQNQQGKTALHIAALNDYVEAMVLLFQHGAHVDAQSKNGESPLHYAAYHNNTNAMILLLNHGAHVDAQNEKGETALHTAANAFNNDCTDAMALLLDHGATIDMPNINGATPLNYEISHCHVGTMAFLLNHGALPPPRTSIWWWNNANLDLTHQFTKHIVTMVQAKTLEEFNAVQVEHNRLAPHLKNTSKRFQAIYAHLRLQYARSKSLLTQCFLMAQQNPHLYHTNPQARFVTDACDWALNECVARKSIAPASSLPEVPLEMDELPSNPEAHEENIDSETDDALEQPKRERESADNEPVAKRTRAQTKPIASRTRSRA